PQLTEKPPVRYSAFYAMWHLRDGYENDLHNHYFGPLNSLNDGHSYAGAYRIQRNVYHTHYAYVGVAAELKFAGLERMASLFWEFVSSIGTRLYRGQVAHMNFPQEYANNLLQPG